MKRLILLSICCLAGIFMANAQKFALIDMEYIMENIPAYQRANNELELASQQYQKAIEAKMKENNDSRKAKQPLEYPNAGSTFKRPEGYFVGKLIDDLGLKGYRIGGAEVSTKHSGFIVNVDHAKAKDVLDLINYIKEKVFEANKVKLEEEIIILGEEV